MFEQVQTAVAADTATKAKPYVCMTCTRPFARLEHLKRHERSHTKEKPFCCDQAGGVPGCGRRFARRDLLLRHQQKIHLFPNVSKRRRMSTASNVSNTSLQQKQPPPAQAQPQQQPSFPKSLPAVPREQCYMLSMPDFDDMANFENGTVNPSSIYGTSPAASVQSTHMQHYFGEQPNPQLLSATDPGLFCFATEILLPADPQHTPWSTSEMPLADSPTSTISSQYSPATSYGSLGQVASLEMAGLDSQLFSPDFFVGNGFHQQQYAPLSSSKPLSHAQLFITTQLEQLAAHKNATMRTGYEEAFQFAGGDQAYCNGFRPSDYNTANCVESF